MRLIVLVPVYNEEKTVISVLETVASLGRSVDHVVVVNDGSTDNSGALLQRWAAGKQHVTVLDHEANRGYSAALLTGFRHVLDRHHQGEFAADDVVATVDADGQHDPAELPGFLATLSREKLDVVWARRDFSRYPAWKRLGNWLMSQVGTLSSGMRFHDIETGYCLFKLRALDAALPYLRDDWRYSISMTLAVTLARLGFRISNEPVASIKLYRSRTRVLDVFVDSAALLRARIRVDTARLRADAQLRWRAIAGAAVFLILAVVMVLMAIKSIYLGADSINNYAHVWYISEHIYKGSLPMHVDSLENGNALTFPYGFLPWTLAAVLRPLFGDYAVTWIMLAGVLLLLAVVYKTRLQRNAWLLAFFAAGPFMLESLLSFQMAFIWALLFGYLYIHAVERKRFFLALVWLILSAGTHLPIMGIILGLYNAWLILTRGDIRKPVLILSILGYAVLAPEMWYIAQSPAISENSRAYVIVITAGTVLIRGALFIWPFLVSRLATAWSGKVLRPATVFVVVVAAAVYGLMLNGSGQWTGGYYGLYASARNDYTEFLDSAAFAPGAVYRVMEATNQEQGQYLFIQRGAVLSNEFFGESMARKQWSQDDYQRFLKKKRIDFVVLNQTYPRKWRASETAALAGLASENKARLYYNDAGGRIVVYDVRPLHIHSAAGPPAPQPGL